MSEAAKIQASSQPGFSEVPNGWVDCALGEIFSFEYGKSLTKASRIEGGSYLVYGSSGIVGFHNEFMVEGPALIVGRKGAAGEVHISKKNFWPIDTTYFIKPSSLLSVEFSFYLLKFCRLKKYESSTAIPGLNRDHAYAEKIRLPPFNEQKRIVSKLEELFSELDKGVENLRTAQQQLKVYRQALLKHAFEGKLTAEWRARNTDKLESAEALLARIQREREARYQQQLAQWKEAQEDWESAGKTGGKPAKPKALKVLPILTAEGLTELSKLPEGWGWTRLGMLIDEPSYGTSKKCSYEAGKVGVLRIPNISSGRIDASDLKFSDFDDSEIAAYALRRGDLLTIRSNGSISLVGQCAVISETEEDFLFAGYLIRLRPNQSLVSPSFLLEALGSHALRKQIERKSKSTSGVNNINSGEIQSLVVPICSVEEQEIVNAMLGEKLSNLDQLESTITTSLQQAETLRQSILKKALSGQLVPQNPDDEPASVLLERIRAERAAQPKARARKARAPA